MDKIRLVILLLLTSVPLFLSAQENKDRDSLVTLIYASSAHLEEINGINYRKIIGPARFLHNNTYLDCDSACWNVNLNEIDAVGNVQVMQEKTCLVGERMKYRIDANMVEVRGNLVSLFDKDGNVLNTSFLDYNTKDSVGVFYSGGAMTNKDGAIIESLDGRYESALNLFSFSNHVAAFTDSTIVKSSEIKYETKTRRILLGSGTTAWNAENVVCTNDGFIERDSSVLHLTRDGYVMTPERELWADNIVYWSKKDEAELKDNIQITDTTQSAIVFADHALYKKKPFDVLLTRKPSLLSYMKEGQALDTAYISSDTIHLYAIERYAVDSALAAMAVERRELAMKDPVADVEKESAKQHEAYKAALKRLKTPPGPKPVAKDTSSVDNDNKLFKDMSSDMLENAPDGNLPEAGLDSTKVSTPLDSTIAEVPLDSTKIMFIDAWHNVRMFKSNVQGKCDSLVYTGIDSIARLYKDPVLWSEDKHQLTSDSMQIVFENRKLLKANMLSNAFIASMEDSTHFNQIKGTEMVGFFKDNDIVRFDALGGASLNAYLREDSLITIMNQKEAKMISARLKNRKVQRIKYIEKITNNALPVYNLSEEDQTLRGFSWQDELRPKDRSEVCDRILRESARQHVCYISLPGFQYTKRYFPSQYENIRPLLPIVGSSMEEELVEFTIDSTAGILE